MLNNILFKQLKQQKVTKTIHLSNITENKSMEIWPFLMEINSKNFNYVFLLNKLTIFFPKQIRRSNLEDFSNKFNRIHHGF